MNLDHQAVCTGCNSSLCQRLYHPVNAACMGRVNDDRQMAHALEHRNSGNIECVAGVLLVGADAALAEDNVLVAARHDVLGAHQEFLHGVCEAALEQDGLAGLTELLQQLEVLHIACADLETVALVHEDVDVRRIGDLSYDRQTGCFVCLVQQLEALSLQTLEGVRGRTRLPRTAAENGRAVRLHMLSHIDDLLLALDRARTCHNDQLLAADNNARCNLNDRVVRMELAVCQLERLLHLDDVLNLRVKHECVLVNSAGVADQTDNDGVLAVDRVCLYVPALDMLGQLLNVLMGRALLHNDDHVVYLLYIGGICCLSRRNGYKKSPSSTKRDERQTVPRYHPHSAS